MFSYFCGMKKQTIFHGSYVAVEKPLIVKSRFAKDFGEGFYCTMIEKQAVRWANRYETPVLSKYEYEPNPNLDVLEFDELSDEWLDFIADCRAGKTHNHDIVIGAMADDQIYNYVSDFISGVISREQFWVLAKFRYPTHQICFCTEKGLETLTFISSEECAYEE